ncbi:hypothetical protein BC834DRAFT_579661 [Gloeopeniophorella convolvens]|nr:hypothetical protein BC834DRAFT_579661 [Gloeopeniophorella convolvens]
MSMQDEVELAHDFASDDDEDEMDWEEVAVPQAQPQAREELEDEPGPSARLNIEITLEARPARGKNGAQKKGPPGGISHAERLLRIDCHKIHTIALIANAQVRNKWINDELLQARLLSLTPLAIQNSFAMIHKSRIPDEVKRGYLFEQAVTRLASWWADTFFNVEPVGHLRNRTFNDVQRILLTRGVIEDAADKVKGKRKAAPPDVDALESLLDDDEVEVVRSPKSLMKHALMRSGSRDVSSQLFTALCRALGIPTRLAVSLQSVPWQTSVGRPKPPTKPKTSKGKEKAIEPQDAEDSDEDMQEVGIPHIFPGDGKRLDGEALKSPAGNPKDKGKAKHTVKLRKTKSVGRKLGSQQSARPPDPLDSPPVFWTEVFSRPDGRWLPVDPIRAIVNKRKAFDPTPAAGTPMRQTLVDNRMSYVVAVEEDGYVRDVTPRYAKQYSAKVAKAQSGGRGQRQWWSLVLSTVTRPYKLHRDDIEDDELAVHQFTEGMPTTLAGFKDHPLYALERHLHRDQVIAPDASELGKFRGEPVYPRRQVLELKAAENWIRRGRVVRAGEQPMKHVKQRAATISRRRELEVRAGGGGDDDATMQGLYAEHQTEPYVPPPVVDGKVPKNDFGNIDLYTPSMLPAGAAHIPHKGVAKVARQLGFNFAEAVTSFEFRKGRAFPVLTGIVVAAENEDAIVEAYWETEHAAAQKEQAKRRQVVLKRWTKLVQGLRIRQRMREEYATGDSTPIVVDLTAPSDGDGAAQPGGFLADIDDIVQPYSLPKATHAVFSSPPRSPAPDAPAPEDSPTPGPSRIRLINDDEDEDMEAVLPAPEAPRPANGVPKSMAALAAEAQAQAEAEAEAAAAPPAAAATAPPPASPAAAPQTRRGRSSTATATPKARPVNANHKRARRRKRAASETESVEDDESEQGERGLAPGDDEDVAPPLTRPAKRARRAPVPTPPAPASGRVLRTRRGKSEAQLAEEREQEAAFRRTVAD